MKSKFQDKMLFLIGGNLSIDEVAEQFISRAGGKNATIALLLLNREGWEKYLPKYLDPWIKRGIKQYFIIILRDRKSIEVIEDYQLESNL